MPAKRFKEDEEDFYDTQLVGGYSMDKRINRQSSLSQKGVRKKLKSMNK